MDQLLSSRELVLLSLALLLGALGHWLLPKLSKVFLRPGSLRRELAELKENLKDLKDLYGREPLKKEETKNIDTLSEEAG